MKSGSTVAAQISALEREADEHVAQLYGLPITLVDDVPVAIDRSLLAGRWVSFACGTRWVILSGP